MAKILIADDEQLIRRLIGDALIKDGHTVLEAEDGQEALSIFEKNKGINLAILDIMMPEIDGWEVCKRIREKSGIPIMLVSARSQDFDQILGFENGADDYVTKPFSIVVLKKRIDTLLQRGEMQAAQENREKLFIEIDGLSVDAEAHQVKLNGETLDFTLKEFNIFYLLIKKPGRVYSRDALIERVWSEEYIGSTRTIDSHVARIRIKLGEWGEKHLLTIYGTGYKIVE